MSTLQETLHQHSVYYYGHFPPDNFPLVRLWALPISDYANRCQVFQPDSYQSKLPGGPYGKLSVLECYQYNSRGAGYQSLTHIWLCLFPPLSCLST